MLSLQRKLFLQIDYAEADNQQLEKVPMHLYHVSVWAGHLLPNSHSSLRFQPLHAGLLSNAERCLDESVMKEYHKVVQRHS